MRQMAPLACAVAATLFLAACSNTVVPDWPEVECASVLTGPISEDTTLESSGTECDYRLEGNVQVASELIIEAGTRIFAEPEARITIREGGSLQVRGNAGRPVALIGRHAEHGSWDGICFFPGHGASSISHATIMWAGRAPYGDETPGCRAAIGGVGNGGAPVNIGNTTVFGSATTGIDATTFVLETFSRNTLAGNIEYGLRVTGDNATALTSAGDYTGETLVGEYGDDAVNGLPYVYLHAGPGSLSHPNQFRTWPALGGTPYHIAEDGPAYPHATLRFEEFTRILLTPGTTFLMGEGAGIEIGFGAALAAFGAEALPITFKAEQAVPGWWQGIRVTSGSLLARHLELAHAGAGGSSITFGGGAVTGCSDVRLSRITDSPGSGVLITEQYGPYVHLEDLTFRNIAGATVDGRADGPPILDDVSCS